MALTLENPYRTIMVDALTAAVGVSSKIEVRQSTTVLATSVLDNQAWPAAVDGVATANAIPDVTIAATGTADNFRYLTSGDALVFAGTASDTGSGGDLEITPNANLVQDGTLQIGLFTITQPA